VERAGPDEPVPATSDVGTVQLAWDPADATPDGVEVVFELQESQEADFAESLRRYLGEDRASFVSGLPDGRYYYRVRQREGEDGEWGPWSSLVAVDVEHYALWKAWTLFGVGGALVLTIITFLFTADRRIRSEEGST